MSKEAKEVAKQPEEVAVIDLSKSGAGEGRLEKIVEDKSKKVINYSDGTVRVDHK